MKRKKFLAITIKLIGLVTIFAISALNFKDILASSFQDTDTLTFINDQPDPNYVVKKFAYISGEVNTPGVYELNDDTRLAQLISMAGGLTSNADTNYINEKLNLSTVIKDSDHILIPTKVVTSTVAGSPGSSNQNLVNINTASEADLENLPGVGPATAAKIIAARPFSTIDDLKNVSGIGDSKFNQVKDLITVE